MSGGAAVAFKQPTNVLFLEALKFSSDYEQNLTKSCLLYALGPHLRETNWKLF
jgi:hypothetical protein